MKQTKVPAKITWILSVIITLLILMSVYRLFFYYHYDVTSRPFSGSVFLLGLRFDARVVCILGLIMLFLSFIPKLNPFRSSGSSRFWNIFLGTAFFIFLIFYGSDFFHYDYLKQRLSGSVLNYFEDAAISASMVWETYPIIRITLFLIILTAAFVWWHNRNLKRYRSTNQVPVTKRSKWFLFVFALLMGIFVFGKIGQYPLRWSDAFSLSDDYKSNTALNPFQSFFSSLKFRNSSFDRKKVAAYYPLMASYLGVQHPDQASLNFTRTFNYPDSNANKPNVVVVICESFSAYKSSMFGNKLNTTPYFNQMCNKGVFFERCFTPALGTARGVWAVLTGIPDVEEPRTASRNPAAVDQHVIMNDFKGYDKNYFIGGNTTWANIRGVLKNNIADLTIMEEEDFKAAKVDVWGVSDKNLFLESNEILKKKTGPFFAIIQTADNHRPYTIPAEDQEEFKKLSFPKDSLIKYGFQSNEELNAFRYTDFCYSKFIEAAKKETYFKNTIFVFVGDHGVTGDAGEMFPQSFTKKQILAEHVPLLFYAPYLLNPARVRQVCSQLDIMPSVATIARQSYTNTTLGRSLFDSADHKQRFAFIADTYLATIGLVTDDVYYYRSLKTKETDIVSVIDNKPIPVNDSTEARKKMLQEFTEAWYETAKYLLLNNKKKQ